MPGASGAVALANFKKAKDVMSSKNRAFIRIVSEDDVQILGTPPTDTKRKTVCENWAYLFQHVQEAKNFRDSQTISTAISRQYVFSSGLLQGFGQSEHQSFSSGQNVFGRSRIIQCFAPSPRRFAQGISTSFCVCHGAHVFLFWQVIINIFLFHQVMSCLHHVGEKTAIEGSAANQKLIEDLTRQCQQEKDKALALEKEVKRLKGNVEQDGMLARADISSLQREKDQLHEEVVQLKSLMSP